jgi:hypothetical protein
MVVLGSQPRYAIPDQVEDLKRAVRYIRYNAKQLGIDPVISESKELRPVDIFH